MEGLLLILVTVAVIILVAWGCFWAIDRVGLPGPLPIIAKAIVALIAVVALLTRTGLLTNFPG